MAQAVVAEARRRLDAEPAKVSYGARLAAATLAVELKDFAAANALFDAALKADKGQARPKRWSPGDSELFMAAQYADAVKVFQRGLDEKVVPPDNARAVYFYLAGALEMVGRTDEALEAARKAGRVAKRFAPLRQPHGLDSNTTPSATTRPARATRSCIEQVRQAARVGRSPRGDARRPAGPVEHRRHRRQARRSRRMARTGARRVSRRHRRAERPGLPVGRRGQAPRSGLGDDPHGRGRRAEEHGLSRQPGLGAVPPGPLSRGRGRVEGGRRGRRRSRRHDPRPPGRRPTAKPATRRRRSTPGPGPSPASKSARKPTRPAKPAKRSPRPAAVPPKNRKPPAASTTDVLPPESIAHEIIRHDNRYAVESMLPWQVIPIGPTSRTRRP